MIAGRVEVDMKTQNRELLRIASEAADTITVAFMEEALDNLPIEDGHAHEAFCAGLDALPLPRSGRMSGQFGHARSGDPEATGRGKSYHAVRDNGVTVSVAAELPFVKILEDGGTIRVGDLQGNKGPKESPDTSRQLYAPRLAEGVGLLAWTDESGTHMAKTRRIPGGYKFFAKAKIKARAVAKQLGLKKQG